MQPDRPLLAFSESDLPAGTIRCFHASADVLDPVIAAGLVEFLDHEERAKAGRFAYAADRRLYVTAHAALRHLLGSLLGCRPAGVRFKSSATGKPLLADGAGLEFSLSHSGDIVLIAIAHDIRVGVDVERVRPLANLQAVAAHYLHPEERSELASMGAADAALGFFRCWTRKEAVAKALGIGLGLRFDRCRVSCRAGEPAALHALDGHRPPPDRWSLHDVSPMPGYAAAVAAQCPRVPVTCHGLSWDA